MSKPSATILADSLAAPTGERLTTMEVTFHRFVLAEFNTHRVFSRNSASSRAIPVLKHLDQFLLEPAMPLSYPAEQSGMQGGAELEGEDLYDALTLLTDWHAMTAELVAVYISSHPDKPRRLHKSVLNRILEPMMWHTVIVSSTDWDGFFEQRTSELAQPEITAAADLMQAAYGASTPTSVEYGDWHTPLIQPDEKHLSLPVQLKVSAARCARVSYMTHDGTRSVEEDLLLYKRLVEAVPMHASPLEHVATPRYLGLDDKPRLGNFRGWDQLRHLVKVDEYLEEPTMFDDQTTF
jgi:hypothetical protein